MKRVAITGVTGRMGKALLRAVLASNSPLQLGAAIHRPDSEWSGRDAASLVGLPDSGVLVNESLSPLATQVDMVIDFSLPDSVMGNLAVCRTHGLPLVSGTTGFTEEQLHEFRRAADSLPIVLAPNMSIGVNLSLYLIASAAQILNGEADVDIIETHHRHKRDAPSGTALAMGQAVADAQGHDFDQVADFYNSPGDATRPCNRIHFSSIRAGDVIGDHSVVFAAAGERVEITHKAGNRSIYTNGALRAAIWLLNQPPGLYSMQSVLGLEQDPQ